MVWHCEQWSLARISKSLPPQTGQAGAPPVGASLWAESDGCGIGKFCSVWGRDRSVISTLRPPTCRQGGIQNQFPALPESADRFSDVEPSCAVRWL